jgi:hypothetical protein
MAKRHLSEYQKGIVKRYYEHRDTIALQKIGELVSDLYVETSEKRINRAWKSLETQLLAAGVHKHQVETIVGDRDLGAVARLLSEIS